ncbi:MAG: DUF2520 domain-containing protein [Ignavibacteriales bacterium]|nr:DUF2520 domain-containing protein [Ignavibacteriales bacterium]
MDRFAAIETQSKSAQKFLIELADRLELHVLSLSSNQKVNYHLAGVFSSNFLVANLFAADELLKKIKKVKSSFEIVRPIIYSTLEKRKFEVRNNRSSFWSYQQRGFRDN